MRSHAAAVAATGVGLLFTCVIQAQTAQTDLVECLVLEHQREILECAALYTQGACFAKYPGNSRELYDCRKNVNQRVLARLDAERFCAKDGRISECVALGDNAVVEVCIKHCDSARDAARRAAVEGAQTQCLNSYVDTHGHSPLACEIGGAIPHVDTTRLSRELAEARAAHDGPALDRLLRLSDGQLLQELQSECTKHCAEDGPRELKALVTVQKQGAGLVASYKHCMASATSAAATRKLEASDTVLYCDQVDRANTDCRTANRCDWVEGNGRMVCEYRRPPACSAVK